jgi:chromosome partitioning protein
MSQGKPRVVVVTSRKGGTGKSTVSSHLSVFAGPAAVLIDTDSQDTEGSSATWMQAREALTPRFHSYDDFKRQGIERLIEQAELGGATHVIVDTAPAADAAVANVMKLADVIVVVTEPSFLPLRALPRSLSIAQATGKPTLVVLNKVKEARLEAEQTRVAFKENCIPFVELSDLADFGRALAEGKAVHEFAPKSKSAHQVAALWKKIEEMF